MAWLNIWVFIYLSSRRIVFCSRRVDTDDNTRERRRCMICRINSPTWIFWAPAAFMTHESRVPLCSFACRMVVRQLSMIFLLEWQVSKWCPSFGYYAARIMESTVIKIWSLKVSCVVRNHDTKEEDDCDLWDDEREREMRFYLASGTISLPSLSPPVGMVKDTTRHSWTVINGTLPQWKLGWHPWIGMQATRNYCWYEVFSYYDDEFLGEFFVIDPSSDSIMLDSNLLWVFLHDTWYMFEDQGIVYLRFSI